MISLPKSVRRLFTHDTTIYECRNCGTTLDSDAESCPNCDAEAISCYDLE